VGSVRAGGLSGPHDQWVDLVTARFAARMSLGPATLAFGHDGVEAWQRGANGEVVLQDSEAGRRAAATDAWIHARGWWFPARHAATVESLGRREVEGLAFDVLRCVPVGGQAVELWFDASTHRLARLMQEVLGKPSTRRFEDHREVAGLWLPHRVATGNGDPRFDRVTEFATITLGETPPDRAFDVPGQVFGDVVFIDGGALARMPIEIRDNHVFVGVEVDGHPLRFLLDTGGVNLVATAAARRIGLASLGAIEARGPGEQSVASGFARVARLVVGGVELFKRLVVQVDYARHELVLADSATFVAPPAAQSSPITFFGHFPGIAGAIDGVAGQFWLDTGNRGGLLLLAPFVEANGFAGRHAASATTTIGWGIGGRAEGRLARGGRLVIGDVVVDAPVLRLPSGSDGALAIRHVAGNIGGEILRRFVVTFDYARRVVHLAANADAGRPFDVDRSGLWINRHARGVVVGAVMAGGPADAVGLRVGDVLTALDGEPAGARPLDAWRRRLAEWPPGRRIAVDFLRGETSMQVALVLRDLV
jgi:hypothetical protein